MIADLINQIDDDHFNDDDYGYDSGYFVYVINFVRSLWR